MGTLIIYLPQKSLALPHDGGRLWQGLRGGLEMSTENANGVARSPMAWSDSLVAASSPWCAAADAVSALEVVGVAPRASGSVVVGVPNIVDSLSFFS